MKHIRMENGEYTKNFRDSIQVVLEPHFPKSEDGIDEKQIKINMNCPVITQEEVKTVMDDMDINKSPGPDGLTLGIIKELFFPDPAWFTELFNDCTRQCVFPDFWKIEKVSLIPKDGKDLTEVSAYRPICLLPTWCKVYDKSIAQRLLYELESKAYVRELYCNYIPGVTCYVAPPEKPFISSLLQTTVKYLEGIGEYVTKDALSFLIVRRDRDGVRTLELHRSYVLRKVALRRTGNSSEKVRSLAVARREDLETEWRRVKLLELNCVWLISEERAVGEKSRKNLLRKELNRIKKKIDRLIDHHHRQDQEKIEREAEWMDIACDELDWTAQRFERLRTEQKKECLPKYPQIKEENIECSRDTSFEKMIMERTDGTGDDIVLNSVADDKFHASMRCVARNGYFVEIGRYDIVMDHEIDKCFQK
ncbi:hypothetical protein AVEN_125802-1 [Araneus ventricosus]|uniref:Reverse transcriptase domain-containing protein n=1 Tax=Araneus ventricosus TaxID=182803 RepID=A0A4Y2KV28_ARAVE|nr:hypothetical protein AVEN_125802-1 [Araneus ventricosus]